jgi:hypothetical protein
MVVPTAIWMLWSTSASIWRWCEQFCKKLHLSSREEGSGRRIMKTVERLGGCFAQSPRKSVSRASWELQVWETKAKKILRKHLQLCLSMQPSLDDRCSLCCEIVHTTFGLTMLLLLTNSITHQLYTLGRPAILSKNDAVCFSHKMALMALRLFQMYVHCFGFHTNFNHGTFPTQIMINKIIQ